MRRFAKLDDNQKQIVTALRAVGCSVQSLASVGGGCPDILVGIRGRNYILEIKDGKKPQSRTQLTALEKIWSDSWRGQYQIVFSVEQALQVISV